MGHLVQLPCRSRVTYSRPHRTLSRRVLNISREADSTTSLGSLFQCSVTLRGKTGSDFMCVGPSILDKRSNSVLLSLDRNISFSGDSNLNLPYTITWNGADFYVSSDCGLTYVLSNKGKLWKDKLIMLLKYTGILILYIYYLILFLFFSQLVLSDFLECEMKMNKRYFLPVSLFCRYSATVRRTFIL